MDMSIDDDSGKPRIRIRVLGDMLVYNQVGFPLSIRLNMVVSPCFSQRRLAGSVSCICCGCLISEAVSLGPGSETIIEKTDENVPSNRMAGILSETVTGRWSDSMSLVFPFIPMMLTRRIGNEMPRT